ncbi:MAG: YbjN domain-containing protein [Leptolyngbya sp. SIO4C1]|nr:YbjN domain-containing protein [Leptolyngbya sp. SIO4C1]
MEFVNDAQALTHDRLQAYLADSLFKDSFRSHDDRPHFDLLYQRHTLIEVDVLPWENHPYPEREFAIVRASSCISLGSGPELGLLRFLLAENRKMRFGSFQTDEAGTVFFANRILGGQHMDLVELETCLLSVAAIAAEYEDLITTQFGGRRARIA